MGVSQAEQKLYTDTEEIFPSVDHGPLKEGPWEKHLVCGGRKHGTWAINHLLERMHR
jgi:hypothetical protein